MRDVLPPAAFRIDQLPYFLVQVFSFHRRAGVALSPCGKDRKDVLAQWIGRGQFFDSLDRIRTAERQQWVAAPRRPGRSVCNAALAWSSVGRSGTSSAGTFTHHSRFSGS
jgi:hypothetical protein